MQSSADFQIFDALEEGVVVASPQGSVLYANTTAKAHSKEGAVAIQDLYPISDAAMLLKQVAECAQSDKKYNLTSALTTVDGQRLWFRFTIQPYKGLVLLLCTNITDCYSNTTDATNAIAQYHKAVLDNTTSGIVLIGPNHEVLCFNREIQKDLRNYFDKDLWVGADYRDFVIDDHKELYLWGFEAAMKGRL
jgi:transcriptional regulator with PAS, ATPase and Fis domain